MRWRRVGHQLACFIRNNSRRLTSSRTTTHTVRFQLPHDLLKRCPHLAGSLITRLRVLFKCAQHCALHNRRQLWIKAARCWRRLVHMLCDNRQRRLGIERHSAGQHFIQHDTGRVQIATLVVVFSLRPFRRHVYRRAHGLTGRRQLARFIHQLGDPKVGQHRPIGTGHQNIGRLDIAMDNAPRVRIRQSVEHMHHQLQRD